MEGTYRALPTPASRLGTRTPAGVSSLEPGQTLGTRPVAPPRDKCLTVHVRLLDDSMEMLDVEPKCDGQVLLAQLWGRLNLMECDYFGLEFQNAPSCWVWLDPAKPLARQVRRPKNTVLCLAVKFFPPDPGQLQEEFTRYLFALQLRRDLREGRLSCTDTTAALLASHLLQAELGDYEETLDREHLKAHQYLPSQEHCLEKILEFHQKHMGQTPAESDFQVLEVARKLEMYGVRLHAASDREGARIHLAAFHTGVLVFQGTTKINTFNWSKVRKLSFRRKRFLVKLHPEAHGPYQDTLEFLLGSRDACKNFWKVCVEHHTFFRLCDQPKPKAKAVLFSRGSSFRYSGRTQKQLVGCIKEGPMRRAPYERRHSRMRACIQETRQSVSFTEGLRTSASPPPADTTPGSLPISPLAPRGHLSLQDNSGPQLEPPALDTMRPAAEGSHRPPCQAQTPGAPAGPPSPGAGSGLGVQNRSPGSPLGQGPEAGVGPIFTVASRQLQVLEEFIDDDPADICFYAGGREAFLPYGASREPPTPCSGQSSPDRFSTEAMHMEDGFGSEEEEEEEEGEEEGGFGAVGHPADTCELLAMKAQASLMHSLLATSSGRPQPHAHGGSLGCLPLTGPAARTPSSATQSEASSMANFPACSVRSESSSGLQFCDLLEQLGQLSGAPGPAPAPASGSSASSSSSSSSSDIESWGSGAQAPLDISLFFSRPFMALGADSLTLDVQSHPRNPAPGDWLDGDHC